MFQDIDNPSQVRVQDKGLPLVGRFGRFLLGWKQRTANSWKTFILHLDLWWIIYILLSWNPIFTNFNLHRRSKISVFTFLCRPSRPTAGHFECLVDGKFVNYLSAGVSLTISALATAHEPVKIYKSCFDQACQPGQWSLRLR